ncbi:uncharacterized protein LOC133180472 [Saccostrea echinata]|uniref:uncharacterized protein LOC133180472 n=1 Tax=Saccostrea echinata TaxID=191078 RepID=UPI002A82FFA3|nr:uncharacterized protein LOC133180472 [Saccostrea echinata]
MYTEGYIEDDFHMESFYGYSMTLVGILAFVLLFYILFKLCTSDEDEKSQQKQPNVYPLTPVFAHELTPGIIVLQSADGEYFRILHEYSSKHDVNRINQNGNVMTSSSTGTSHSRVLENAQTQTRPSAPVPVDDLLMNIHEPVTIQPPPYSAWRTEN